MMINKNKGALKDFEERIWAQEYLLLGIDEAGRGPLAGPCVVCGVILKPYLDYSMIDDSKVLSEKKREKLVSYIKDNSVAIYTKIVSVEEIDTYNIYRATQKAMQEIADESLAVACVLSDAMPLDVNGEFHSLIKGDHKSISIAAASIIAKTMRDDIMKKYDELYPDYGFAKHKGYPTKQHYEAIKNFGVLAIHRKSYKLFKESQISFDI